MGIKIELVQQYPNECVLASVAMITGLDYEYVREQYPEFDGEGITTSEMIKLLKKFGCQPIQYVEPVMHYSRLYLLTVPSLNYLGGNHCIVVNLTERDETGNYVKKIYDPANGLPNKKFYSEDLSNELAVELRSYSEVVEIPFGDD